MCILGMRFLYILSGWEGSIADVTMYSHSHCTDLTIPDGKYYLADAGFGICDSLLVPYWGVRYHLAEWGRANQKFVYLPLDLLQVLVLISRPLGHPTRKNSIIYDMHQHEILSSESLEC